VAAGAQNVCEVCTHELLCGCTKQQVIMLGDELHELSAEGAVE
jgi:hypothetical protein